MRRLGIAFEELAVTSEHVGCAECAERRDVIRATERRARFRKRLGAELRADFGLASDGLQRRFLPIGRAVAVACISWTRTVWIGR